MDPLETGEEETRSWQFEQGNDITAQYVAMKLLGGGHSYEVYLAQDMHRLALVVVKLLRPHLVDEARERRSLERELKVLESLNHPVIVRSFGHDLDNERPHIVLEHLEGPHLSRLIRQHPLAIEQIIPLAVQICSALHYMSMESMVHLDVKPRNIIMGAPPRLIDLSIARSFAAAAALKAPIGTDPYMAPEQCDPRRAAVGPAADVWGIGATLYHALTGHVPFPRADDLDRSDPVQRWPQLVEKPDPLPREVPQDLRDVVSDCLNPDPAQRPSAVEVVSRLDPLVEALPSRPVLRRLRPRLGRKRR